MNKKLQELDQSPHAYCLSYKPLSEKAKTCIKDIKICHKYKGDLAYFLSTYFALPSENYETAAIGTMHLMPNELFNETLKQDCREMSEMFFQGAPDFDEIMAKVAQIEKTINSQEKLRSTSS